MDSIAERIEIIDKFTSKYPDRTYDTETGKGSTTFLFYIYPILAVVLIAIVLWSITCELTGLQSKFNWNKANLLVLISISTLFNALKGFYANILLKHLGFLKNSTLKNLDENSNIQLTKIIAANNKPMGANLLITFLAIAILIGALTNFFMDKQFIYYKFFIVPTLLFYVLTILDGIKTYKKLKANINAVESSLTLLA